MEKNAWRIGITKLTFMKARLTKLIFVAALIVGVLGVGGAAYAAVTINATTVSSDGALTLTGATASTWSVTSGDLTVSTGAGALLLTAVGATAGDITLTTGDDFTLNGVATSVYTIGAATTGGTITIGGTAQTAALNIGVSSATLVALNLGTGAGATTINIGTDNSVADDINIGSALDDVDITGASAFVAGTSDALTITANAASTWSTTAGDLTLSADAASVNINANEAAADQIVLNAAGTIAGNAINIKTTNGGIVLTAGNATNGDITINAGDALILGDLLTGDNAGSVTIFSDDWEITATGTITGVAFDANGTGNTLTNVEEADLTASSGFGLGVLRTARAKYDFAVDGGVVGAITLATTATLPDNAVIVAATINSTTAVVGTSSTLAVGTTAGSSATSILAATAEASLSADALINGVPVFATPVKMTAAGNINVTVGTANLTAGVVEITLLYYVAAN